ncbi:flagellar biosynthesis chaperone FliJ [Pseudomonas sp. TE3786]
MTNQNKKILQVSTIDQENLSLAINDYENNNMGAAITQFLKLAEHDSEEAFLYLSLIYRDGDGTRKNKFQSARYRKMYIQSIEAKAATGLSAHQLKLAYILQFGDGVKIDSSRAFSLFLELAKKGEAEAQFHLSRIYAHGHCGQKKDSILELQWLDEATKSEWPLAIYYSALLLVQNPIVLESTSKIIEMMNRSSELGCWQAKDYLLSVREN